MSGSLPIYPPVLPSPIAENGDKTDIVDTSTNEFNYNSGFPSIFSVPVKAGGLAPKRTSFNEAFYLLSSHAYYQQCGAPTLWQDSLSYPVNAKVFTASTADSSGQEYICIKANGAGVDGVGAKAPTDNPEYWVTTLSLVPQASMTQQGLIEIATQEEVNEGTNNNRCVTPEGLFGAKTSITNWGFPSDSKINLGVINQYMAPACGFLGATSNTTNINSWLKITSNVGINSESFYNSAGGSLSVYIAISKGQTGYINAYNGDIISVYFIYAQGEI